MVGAVFFPSLPRQGLASLLTSCPTTSKTCGAWFRKSTTSLPQPLKPPELGDVYASWAQSSGYCASESRMTLIDARNERGQYKNVSIYVTDLPPTPSRFRDKCTRNYGVSSKPRVERLYSMAISEALDDLFYFSSAPVTNHRILSLGDRTELRQSADDDLTEESSPKYKYFHSSLAVYLRKLSDLDVQQERLKRYYQAEENLRSRVDLKLNLFGLRKSMEGKRCCSTESERWSFELGN
jgi:hypothetical protein